MGHILALGNKSQSLSAVQCCLISDISKNYVKIPGASPPPPKNKIKVADVSQGLRSV